MMTNIARCVNHGGTPFIVHGKVVQFIQDKEQKMGQAYLQVASIQKCV